MGRQQVGDLGNGIVSLQRFNLYLNLRTVNQNINDTNIFDVDYAYRLFLIVPFLVY